MRLKGNPIKNTCSRAEVALRDSYYVLQAAHSRSHLEPLKDVFQALVQIICLPGTYEGQDTLSRSAFQQSVSSWRLWTKASLKLFVPLSFTDPPTNSRQA